ncbi:hypothetical protein ABZZ17_14290 [Streptomyces sp. NPDC006512]|uniref:hypothetical protein n=1 Tax=Streptomyces sp. NPDC006512 TaxID=3154307 RepID=UPI0033B09404
MGIFSRKSYGDDPYDRDMDQVYDNMTGEERHQERIRDAHAQHDSHRSSSARNSRRENSSGPSTSDANTPKRGRRW